MTLASPEEHHLRTMGRGRESCKRSAKQIGGEWARRVWSLVPMFTEHLLWAGILPRLIRSASVNHVPTLVKLAFLSVPETRREYAQNRMLLQGQVGSGLSIIHWTYQQGAHWWPCRDNGWVEQKPDSSGLRSGEEKMKQWILPWAFLFLPCTTEYIFTLPTST